MTKNEILLFVYNSNNIKSSAKRITKGDDLYNDLLSELLIIVSELDFEFVNDLYSRGKLEAWCWKTMYYQYTQPHMAFYKKYRSFETTNAIEYDETNVDEIHAEVVELMNRIEKRIAQKRFPTELRLLELYVKHGTYRAVGKEVNISFKTAQYLVKQITETIKKEYDTLHNN